MDFDKKVPEWTAEGVEPPASLKQTGFEAGYKPPAAYFNWFWTGVSACLKEIREKLSGHANDKENPHGVTAEQIGAVTADELSNLMAEYDDIFIATYGETTMEELDAAFNAGKLLFCRYGAMFVASYYVGIPGETYMFLIADHNGITSYGLDAGGWTTGSILYPPQTHADSHKTGGDDALTPADIGAAEKSQGVQVTVGAAAWTGEGPYTATLTCSIATATNNLIVGAGAGLTAEEHEAMSAAMIVCTAQAEGSITLTAFGTLPEIGLRFYVLEVG